MAGRCYMNDAKREPIKKFYRSIQGEYTDYVGIAIDEPGRLQAMKERNKCQISLLEKYGFTEEMAKQKCIEYNLLSPTYAFSKRDGCWFCPNQGKNQLRHLRNCHPEEWEILKQLEKEENIIGSQFDNRGGKSILAYEEMFYWEDAQLTIFDLLED